MEIAGEREYKLDAFTTLHPFKNGDLYLSVMKGGAGLGDPLLRAVEEVERDVREEHLLPRFAESAYGVSDRDAYRARRLERGRPTGEWWEQERERVAAQRVIEPIKRMYAESFKLSPRFAAEYRGFWDLDEDFEWDAATPTVPAAKSQKGKVTPAESAAEYLATSDVRGGPPPQAAAGRSLEEDTLGDMLDEKLSRRAVRDVQSGYKDPDRFDKWLAVLGARAGFDDPIVLPCGEGLNIVRRPGDSALVIRCDCGHDLCGHTENWKMHALVFVRDTGALMEEIFPKMGHADPDWQELREFYCPSCARQLEVEAVPPGYPVVHEFLPDVEGFYRGWLGREVPG